MSEKPATLLLPWQIVVVTVLMVTEGVTQILTVTKMWLETTVEIVVHPALLVRRQNTMSLSAKELPDVSLFNKVLLSPADIPFTNY